MRFFHLALVLGFLCGGFARAGSIQDGKVLLSRASCSKAYMTSCADSNFLIWNPYGDPSSTFVYQEAGKLRFLDIDSGARTDFAIPGFRPDEYLPWRPYRIQGKDLVVFLRSGSVFVYDAASGQRLQKIDLDFPNLQFVTRKMLVHGTEAYVVVREDDRDYHPGPIWAVNLSRGTAVALARPSFPYSGTWEEGFTFLAGHAMLGWSDTRPYPTEFYDLDTGKELKSEGLSSFFSADFKAVNDSYAAAGAGFCASDTEVYSAADLAPASSFKIQFRTCGSVDHLLSHPDKQNLFLLGKETDYYLVNAKTQLTMQQFKLPTLPGWLPAWYTEFQGLSHVPMSIADTAAGPLLQYLDGASVQVVNMASSAVPLSLDVKTCPEHYMFDSTRGFFKVGGKDHLLIQCVRSEVADTLEQKLFAIPL